MPNVIKRFLLTDAIKALPSQTVVQYSVWIPASNTLPGFAQGAWGEWTQLPRPYTCDRPAPDAQIITAGGQVYVRSLDVYMSSGQIPTEFVPESRSCRVRASSGRAGNPPQPVFRDDDIYQVVEIRVMEEISDHAEIFCTRWLKEAPVQA